MDNERGRLAVNSDQEGRDCGSPDYSVSHEPLKNVSKLISIFETVSDKPSSVISRIQRESIKRVSKLIGIWESLIDTKSHCQQPQQPVQPPPSQNNVQQLINNRINCSGSGGDETEPPAPTIDVTTRGLDDNDPIDSDHHHHHHHHHRCLAKDPSGSSDDDDDDTSQVVSCGDQREEEEDSGQQGTTGLGQQPLGQQPLGQPLGQQPLSLEGEGGRCERVEVQIDTFCTVSTPLRVVQHQALWGGEDRDRDRHWPRSPRYVKSGAGRDYFRDYFLLLPDHVLAQIFGYLKTYTLAALKCTCSDFKWLIEAYDVRGTDSRWVTDPRYREDPCMQCGKLVEDRGDVSLCRWHPNIYYKNGHIGRNYWTCCYQLRENSPGCMIGLHDNNWLGCKQTLRRIPRRHENRRRHGNGPHTPPQISIPGED